jgi:hypothetical protein
MRPKSGADARDQPLQIAFRCDVGGDRDRATTAPAVDLGRNRLTGCLIPGRDDDIGSMLSECIGDGPTGASRRARHDGTLAS